MRNYLCKWLNGDVVLISARDKLQVREILDEVGDPGACEIKRMKGAFAIEFIPKVPRPPRQAFHNPGAGFGRDDFEAPDDPTIRPNIVRWAGNTGQTLFADLYQEYGGQLAPAEAAAVERWKAAVQQQQGRARGRGAAAAAAEEPWVTEEQLTETGLLDNPYHIHADLGGAEYGHYSSRILKHMTKNFFPRTYEALQPLADQVGVSSRRFGDQQRNDSVMSLRAALASDVRDKEKEDEQDRKRARLMVAANSGDRNAILQIMTDQTANVYGPEDDDDEDDFYTLEEDDDSSDGDLDVVNALRHGRALGLAAALGIPR